MKNPVLKFLCQRFGIPTPVFDGFVVTVTDRQAWLSTPEAGSVGGPVRRRGVQLAEITAHGPKLTAQGALAVGRDATHNTLELDDEDARAFMEGKNIQGDFGELSGQVIIRWKGFPVGVGLIQGKTLKNQLPLSRRLPPELKPHRLSP